MNVHHNYYLIFATSLIDLKKTKTYPLYEHRLPEYFNRFPFLIRPVHWGHQLLHNRNRILLHLLKKEITSRGGVVKVLDAGCGEGNYLIPLAHTFPGSHFKGLDYNAQLVNFVNLYAKTYSLKIKSKQADLNTDKLSGNYDVIVCVAVLQMLKNDRLFLKEVYKALKDDGLLVLNVPLKHRSIIGFLQRNKNGYAEVHGGILRPYTLKSITTLLQEEGFRIQHIKVTNGYFGTMGNELLNWGIHAIQSGSILKRIVSSLFFLILVLPLVFLCNLFNAILPKKRVSGVIGTAQKERNKT